MLPDCVPNAFAFPIAALRIAPGCVRSGLAGSGAAPGSRVPNAFGVRSAGVSCGTCVPDRAFRITRSGRPIANAFRGTTKARRHRSARGCRGTWARQGCVVFCFFAEGLEHLGARRAAAAPRVRSAPGGAPPRIRSGRARAADQQLRDVNAPSCTERVVWALVVPRNAIAIRRPERAIRNARSGTQVPRETLAERTPNAFGTQLPAVAPEAANAIRTQPGAIRNAAIGNANAFGTQSGSN